MNEPSDLAPKLPPIDDAIATKRIRWFDDDYVAEMVRFLGPNACRRLAIFPLPRAFTLSVIVPVYNECDTVADVLERLRQTGLPVEIILVDDGSNDGSSEVLDTCSIADDVTLIRHERNRGKGAAIRSGIEAATGDVIVIQDADSEYDPDDLRGLLQPLIENSADVVYGTRYGHCDRQVSPWWHQAVNGFITTLANVSIGPRLSDVETCYKMSTRENFQRILPQLKEDRFGIEIELTARWARLGLRFTERPIRYQHRWYDEGKKITWKDGVSALFCIAKYGLFRR
ncbi:glycosyltransferase involved in cell wall biosynthesis [Rhodopirellula rubra]|uniref:Glycosyltransferase involved in cell wall biosynthesis n=1 Tax=Aporhodopirellula rubra TaxID=980271 RepID=A0A7W5E5J7_9BACT|nr:glycosyltransferase family 2 protein [Aporhodopirellula rubra]MBB3209953.1 glycosyltransferase involved in cell wall biosynthesis [Aporhodopirellula rubra]